MKNKRYIPAGYTSEKEEDEKDLNFWATFAVMTDEVASQISDVTDSELRRRIFSLQIQLDFEIKKLMSIAATIGKLPQEIVRFSHLGKNEHAFVKSKKKVVQLTERIDHIEEVLYARLVMKDPQGIPVWLGILFYLTPPDRIVARNRKLYPD